MDNCDDENANCMDTVGSFLCMCNVGFSGDGVSCDGTYRHTEMVEFSSLLSVIIC